MSNQNDGGQAFATTATATSIARRDDGSLMLTNYGSSAGMSLRDYFAAAALQGICANSRDDYSETTREDKAQESYRQADAMIREREAK